MFPQSVDTNSGDIKQFLQFIGENEDMKHYSDVLLQTDTFMDYTKSSTHQGGVGFDDENSRRKTMKKKR